MASADSTLMVPSAFFCWFSERATPSVMTPVTTTSATVVTSPPPSVTVTEVRRPGVATTVWLTEGRPI
ncbi:hypothetical protein D3C72_1608980 [compost metagenome]